MENRNSLRTMMLAGAALSISDPAISQSAGEVPTAGKCDRFGGLSFYTGGQDRTLTHRERVHEL
jgi:hypothetical protein